ncbi:MAG: PAS domain S-box protein [Pseudomonadota bacterium]
MPEKNIEVKGDILVVADQAAIAPDVESRLEAWGYFVCGKATSGEQALEWLERRRPTLVMMDLALPGKMDGREAAEIIMKRWGLPVVLLTAPAGPDPREQTGPAYPCGTLAKPFHDRDLKAALETALGEARMGRGRTEAETDIHRLILKTALDGFRLMDKHGHTLEVNDAYCEMTGYTESELLAMNVFDLEAVGDKASRDVYIEKIIRQGQYRYETRHRRKDGSLVKVEVGVRHQPVKGGVFAAFIRDISEKTRQRDALRLNSLVLDQIKDHVTVTDLAGVITYVNQAQVGRLGRSRDELLGQSTGIYGKHSELGASQQEIVEKTLQNGFWRGEVVNYAADGAEIIMDCRTQVICDENDAPTALCGISTDITEFRAKEKALAESRGRLAEYNRLLTAVLEHTHMSAAYLDSKFNFIWVNRAYAATCRLDSDFFTGRNHFDLYPHREKQAIFQRVVDSGEPFFAAAKPFIFPDQPERGVTYWDWSLFPVKNEDGEAAGLVLTLAEVTERVQAGEALRNSEEKLQRSEEHYRAIFNIAPHGIQISDVAGNIIQSNPAHHRLQGYERNELVGKKVWDLVAAEAEKLSLKEYYHKIIVEQPAPETYFNQNLTMDGRLIEVKVDWDYIRAADGGLEGVCSIITNVTEQKKAETALREGEARFRFLIKNASDILVIINEDGKQRYVSSAAERITGFPPEELVGKALPEIIHPDDMASVHKAWDEALIYPERVLCVQYRHIHKKRGWVHLEALGQNFLREPSVGGFVISVRDITERKMVEERLQAKTDELDRYFTNSLDLLCIANTRGEFIRLNPEWEKILGYSIEDLEGRKFLDYVHPDDIEGTRAALVKLSAQEDVKCFENRYRARDGSYRWIEWRAKPIGETIYAVARDVTNRKLTEEAIRKSEAAHRALVEALPDLVMRFDRQGRHLFVSENIADFFDLDPRRCLGRTHRELGFSEGPRRFWEGSIQEVLDGGRVFETEFSFEGRLGETVLNCRFLPEFTPAGEVQSVLSINRDITAHRRAEQKYQESERKALEYKSDLELYSNLTLLGIIVFDNDFKVVSWNPGAEKIFGYTPEEAIGKDSFDILIPDYEHAGVRNIHLPTDPKVTVHVNDNKTKDGRIITVEWFNCPRFDFEGNLSGLITACQDVTARIRSEKALRESEAKYRVTFDSIPDIITITHVADGRYSYVNDSFSEITGYSREEVIGRTPRDINLYENPEDRVAMMQTLKKNGQLLNYEVRFRKKDGTFFDSLFSARPLVIDNQECLSALTKDITEQKKMEKERNLLQVQLQQAQKMEAIGTLAGGIAHDFNNLLQAINGYTQIMLMEKKPTDHDYANLAAVQKAGNQAAELIRQLLQFSRKSDSKQRPMELNHEMEYARGILERTIPRMIELNINVGGRLWPIQADPVQMEQVLLNLGTNAADAMPDGGKLVITAENLFVGRDDAPLHPGVAPGRWVLLTVSDTGSGMDRDTVEKIFDPFFTTKEIGKGTGLGLASVYGIVQNHGGRIACHSVVGRGTTFRIYLPAIELQEPGEAHDPDSGLPRGGEETILLVDDEAAIRDFAAQALRKFGYTVLTAANGERALEIFAGGKAGVDLVIMDIGMPGMGGNRCIQEMLRLDPGAGIIIASGYSIKGPVRKTLDSGTVGYVAKPYQLVDFLNKVRNVLDGKAPTPNNPIASAGKEGAA